MLKKLLGKSGRRILRAIKKLSTRSRRLKKSQRIRNMVTPTLEESTSLSLSLPSLDTRSVDTYLTYVEEPPRCYRCAEFEENQRNENMENEMMTA